MDGKRCKINCGECCEQYWYEVFGLEKHPGYSCPHLGPEGCKLPRPERPRDCLVFLCMDSEMHGYIEVKGEVDEQDEGLDFSERRRELG